MPVAHDTITENSQQQYILCIPKGSEFSLCSVLEETWSDTLLKGLSQDPRNVKWTDILGRHNAPIKSARAYNNKEKKKKKEQVPDHHHPHQSLSPRPQTPRPKIAPHLTPRTQTDKWTIPSFHGNNAFYAISPQPELSCNQPEAPNSAPPPRMSCFETSPHTCGIRTPHPASLSTYLEKHRPFPDLHGVCVLLNEKRSWGWDLD
ncbi:hypothetical protein P280DRAFT_506740 [Massarina eburnea CBS 473.64]|uniref:Uncharacterized protein n=1 Tax=Massarina eburnea CBS 473.64 TaxID=1395130 RepID=A0A6A6S187_9PLEO|nr:hypothetical protein P280DRAFT_506740 [Massarina eburnea CBS 473.64]